MDIEKNTSQDMGTDGKAMPSTSKNWADDASEKEEEEALEDADPEELDQDEKMNQEEEEEGEY